jgi:plasmid stability protein
MKTTLNIDDGVMKKLREEAARRGTTMSELVEAGLRLILAGAEKAPRPRPRDLPAWSSGGARVDIADRDALYSLLDGP